MPSVGTGRCGSRAGRRPVPEGRGALLRRAGAGRHPLCSDGARGKPPPSSWWPRSAARVRLAEESSCTREVGWAACDWLSFGRLPVACAGWRPAGPAARERSGKRVPAEPPAAGARRPGRPPLKTYRNLSSCTLRVRASVQHALPCQIKEFQLVRARRAPGREGYVVADWLIAALTAITVIAGGGQAYAALKQAKLARLQAVGAEIDRWQRLKEQWHIALLAAYGPGFSLTSGVNPSVAKQFRYDLRHFVHEGARAFRAHQRAYDVVPASGDMGNSVQEAFDIRNEAQARLLPYSRPVNAVINHLAGTCSLVLNGTISSRDAYEILGPEVVEHKGAVRRLLQVSPEISGCPGSEWDRAARWVSLSLDEVAAEIGWDDGLAAAAGTRFRILLLLDLLSARAVVSGDAADPGLARSVVSAGSRPHLEIAWASARTVSRRAGRSAVKELLKSSRAAPFEPSAFPYPPSPFKKDLPPSRWSPILNQMRNAAHATRTICNDRLIELGLVHRDPRLRNFPQQSLIEYTVRKPTSVENAFRLVLNDDRFDKLADACMGDDDLSMWPFGGSMATRL